MPPTPTPHLVIDARPRGPKGPLAGEQVLGRSVLEHTVALALTFKETPIVVHGRFEEHGQLRELIGGSGSAGVVFATGPPPEDATILRTDRFYDPTRLRRALRQRRDPESAVLWRLDGPQGLRGAEAELVRRQSYQPIGKYWALAPARAIARVLQPTRVRPNAITLASAGLMIGASLTVAFGALSWVVCLGTSAAMALALVLDTADGHLARLQGTSSEFGRWLDAYLDELCDMAIHAAIAWSAFVRDGHAGWLLLGMLYGMGKYLFMTGNSLATGDTRRHSVPPHGESAQAASRNRPENPRLAGLTRLVQWVGHADLRWHLWIVLAALGRLEWALGAYALYFPSRSLAGAIRKGVRLG